jgi:hypothetical protein
MDKNLNLANRLYEVVLGNLTCADTWSYYLFHKDFDRHPELRNKVGTIWVCSLFDTLDASQHYIPAIKNEANELGLHSIAYNCDQMQKFCAATAELLDKFTKAEQVFLVDVRNQSVHGYLNGRHQRQVSIKYLDRGNFIKEKLKHSDYADLIRPFYEFGEESVLSILLRRVLDRSLLYWRLTEGLRRQGDNLYRGIREGERFQIRT